MFTEMTDSAILACLGKRLKEYRLRANLMQSELAKSANVGVGTIVKLEQGKPTSTMLLISVMRSLGMLENFDMLIPEPPVSPLQLRKLQGKTIQRIKRSQENG